ncbi:hypothetical protein ARALYDRAFT_899405 [Arabidopsis lyrata subsp. lyrata]|uniref:HTH myb-type domain-containing protein n=1 Tax=Arabidopsis lyrata subsp. lyrata TaxID=81972 RepID=D7L9D1_ARALL|nr:hypothetical protein ARALYDRAFT_899405 [Arabidopsis lyrata subsp. lyrata]
MVIFSFLFIFIFLPIILSTTLTRKQITPKEGKITPCIFYTSDEKARLRWSRDLHDCFVTAVEKLGGPDKATPKSVKETMEVEGIALHHVKSHLQNDLRLRRCREAQRMQTAFAIENQRNMFETQYLKASMNPTLPSQYNNNISTSTTLSQQSSSQEQWFIPLSYHFSEGDTNPFTMNYSQQPSIIIPQNTTSVKDFCNDDMACLSLSELNQNTCNTFSIYEASIHPTQGNLQLNDNQSYDMAQGFVNPYMSIESQSMHGLSTITTQQQLQVNNSCVIHDSYHNATFSSATVPPTINSLHQDTLNNTIVLSTTPQSIQASVPHNQYPPYNTLEVVKAQLNALQDSSTNQTQETLSRGTTLSSSVTRDEVDPVDTYIDWDKVNERDIELDLVEIL